ncbi:uncharacterized protein LOC133330550 [Musca vetustissima]|uniref:uncharacterized protein LOC133330550 n=1 Tax=Musca vetustissima TaxID=27455 RepID=UPI002AB6B27C|nr:uncharacterized protein LOC133330550 [Musca vetustissima]
MDPSKLLVITEDVIPDVVEMDQKKVIRVNPLDLPPIKEDPNKMSEDSSLYKIQSIKPYKGKRKYANSQNMRRLKGPAEASRANDGTPVADSPIVRGLPPASEPKFVKPKHQPKKKHLHFLYNQDDLLGDVVTKTMRVHVAPGAYPVFYAVAKTNGSFGKYPLKNFSSAREFRKYLQKNKVDSLALVETVYDKELQ